MVVGAEALGVSRALATQDGYAVDVNRELYAVGAANALAGLSSGFVQSGGASQTAAAEGRRLAGGGARAAALRARGAGIARRGPARHRGGRAAAPRPPRRRIVGHIESGLPSFGLPDASASDYGALAGGAVGVMLVGFAESLGAGKTYAARDHYEIDAGRELIGLGAANLASGLSSGMVVNGSLSKTASTPRRARARSCRASWSRR